MSQNHFFIGEPSERWTEAFPQGRVIAAEALEAFKHDAEFGQALLWLCAANSSWLELLRRLAREHAGARVAVLSDIPAPAEGLRALNEGARAYAHAHAVPALLQELAVVLQHGGLWVGPELLARLVSSTHSSLASSAKRPAASPSANGHAAPNPWSLLTESEARVARAVTAGCSNKEAAELLAITVRTVKAQLGSIFERLGVRDRLQLVLHLGGAADASTNPDALRKP